MSDIVYAPIRVKRISDTLFDLGIKIEDFKKFLDENNSNGWVNVNICKSKEKDTWYAKLNSWKPNKPSDSEVPEDEIPF